MSCTLSPKYAGSEQKTSIDLSASNSDLSHGSSPTIGFIIKAVLEKIIDISTNMSIIRENVNHTQAHDQATMDTLKVFDHKMHFAMDL